MGCLEVYGEVGRAEGVSGEEAEVVLKGAWKRLAWKNTRERGNENQRPREGPLWTHPSLLAPRGSAGETEAWPSAELISAAWPLPSTLPTLDGPHSRVVEASVGNRILWGFGMGPSDIRRVYKAHT